MNGVPIEAGEASTDFQHPILELNRWFSILDLILRILAAAGTLASAIAMGTNKETIPVVSQLIIKAEYDDLPTFKFFVIVNSIVCGYLVVLSLPLSIFHVIKTAVKLSRIILLIFDTAMLALLSAGASAATAIVYLAHEGSASANWLAICEQFNSLCERITGCLIGSFGAVILLFIIISTSALAISRAPC